MISKYVNSKLILFVGAVNDYNGHNTSNHRLKALIKNGHKLEVLDSTTNNMRYFQNLVVKICNKLFNLSFKIKLPDYGKFNKKLLQYVSKKSYDYIWIEKGLFFNKQNFNKIKSFSPQTKLIGFSPDDMNARHNQSLNFLESLSCYDFFITTKSYNVKELKLLGANQVFFVNNGFDLETFKPYKKITGIFKNLNKDICFIGTYEKQRANSIYFLALNGLIVNVFGNDWNKMKKKHKNILIHNRPLYGPDFAMACGYFKINLCFLRKINRDLQTTRSVEIPACGGFMLSERSVEHEYLFEDGKETIFFDSDKDLLKKCIYYLDNENKRVKISLAGEKRTKKSNYSNFKIIGKVMEKIIIQN
jgi:spore maturation protein CgeB